MAAGETTHDGPSRSAYSVALLRAQHQVVEGGSIFTDPFAIPIVGSTVDNLARAAHEFADVSVLRQYIASRSRFAEDSLAAAVDRGVRQVVVLGAGLDTFGLRNPHANKGVRVFEVDRPATQLWKRLSLDRAKLSVPPGLTFVPVDFEKESFLQVLASSGFKAREPAFFIWLGVVSYLSRQAIDDALASIATIPEAEVVFDYGEPPDLIPPKYRARYTTLMTRMEAAGEPWVSFFTPAEIAADLSRLGFSGIEDLGPDEIAARYFREGVPVGGHIVHARI